MQRSKCFMKFCDHFSWPRCSNLIVRADFVFVLIWSFVPTLSSFAFVLAFRNTTRWCRRLLLRRHKSSKHKVHALALRKQAVSVAIMHSAHNRCSKTKTAKQHFFLTFTAPESMTTSCFWSYWWAPPEPSIRSVDPRNQKVWIESEQ